jgi:pentatricopeptide repeat protein
MERVATLLADMESSRIQPNVITYSTMLKGHCLAGEMELGFKLLRQMKQAGLKPDEIVYNSLLDGCAQHGLVEEGLGVLDEMQREGVKPSNFTLSVVIKLMGRSRRLDQAFSMVREISRKHNLKLNVHVYMNLAQACVSNRSLPQALDLLEEAIQNGVKPENRFYSILVRVSLQQGLQEQAIGLLRGALGLPGALPFLVAKKEVAICPSLEDSLLNEALQSLIGSNANELALQLLLDIKNLRPKVRVSLDVQRRLMTNSRGNRAQDGRRVSGTTA